MWHDGLRYKILNINLPDIIEKITCNYITNRTASIRVGSTLGPPIPLMSGVPQGSILSPTLFNFYTHDIPRPSPGCFNIVFADDCTQVVTDPGKSKRFLARKTEIEIEKLNLFEKQWKISTNKNKFQIISVSATKPATIMVDNQVIPFKASATVLGLTIRTRGIPNHITSRIGRARAQLQKLKRFEKMKTETRLHLYKTLVRPILEYPAIPICTASRSQIKKMQSVQSKALRSAAKERPIDQKSINEELHHKFNVEDLNARL